MQKNGKYRTKVAEDGGRKIRRCQGIAVDYYGFTLGALTLAPSVFCNAEVTSGKGEA